VTPAAGASWRTAGKETDDDNEITARQLAIEAERNFTLPLHLISQTRFAAYWRALTQLTAALFSRAPNVCRRASRRILSKETQQKHVGVLFFGEHF